MDSMDEQQEKNDVNPDKSIHMVFQRYRQARILLNEDEVVTLGRKGDNDNIMTASTIDSVGLLVYISFAKSATKDLVQQAAKITLNLPIVTVGGWGDGTTPQSLLQIASLYADNIESSISLLIVPQANLISKLKKPNGKYIQYHGQIGKEEGYNLYQYYTNCIHEIVQQHIDGVGNKKPPVKKQHDANDASIPPHEMFRNDDKYGSFDKETGMPLTLENGDPLTKSAQKKLQKIYAAQTKRHEKYKQQKQKHMNETASEGAVTVNSETVVAQNKKDDDDSIKKCVDPTFLNIVCGTFGKRQGLELYSDMGPFCHTVEI